MMRRLLIIALCALLLSGCAAGAAGGTAPGAFTDALGREVRVKSAERVVALYGSLAEAWLLAGGSSRERRRTPSPSAILRMLRLRSSAPWKAPDMEAVFALEPDLVMMSADIEAQTKLVPAFEEAGVTCVCLREGHV